MLVETKNWRIPKMNKFIDGIEHYWSPVDRSYWPMIDWNKRRSDSEILDNIERMAKDLDKRITILEQQA